MSRNSTLTKRKRAAELNAILTDAYPDAHCELHFSNPLELTVATVLSAQTTDIRVNSVTPTLFQRYPTAKAYASADREEMEQLLRPLGFFRSKARSLINLGVTLCESFNGEVPRTMKELTSIKGIGRKTANVILGNAFDIPGLPVDTHVKRLARRWELTDNTDPVKIEEDLCTLLPETEWTMFSHRTIFHGRRVCHARKPACGACMLAKLCPSYGDGPTDPSEARALVTTGGRK